MNLIFMSIARQSDELKFFNFDLVSLKFQPNIMHCTQLGYDLHLHKLNFPNLQAHQKLADKIFIQSNYVHLLFHEVFSADRLTLKNIIQICELNFFTCIVFGSTSIIILYHQCYIISQGAQSLHRHFLIKNHPSSGRTKLGPYILFIKISYR